MSKLSDFLHPVIANEEREVIVSTRFVQHGEDGKPLLDGNGNPIPAPFKIRALTQEENDALSKKAMKTVKDRTGIRRELDTTQYTRLLVVTATVSPDFSDAKLCEAYGVLDPLLVPGKMLYAGEYQKLAEAISDLSRIGEDVEEEAKN